MEKIENENVTCCGRDEISENTLTEKISNEIFVEKKLEDFFDKSIQESVVPDITNVDFIQKGKAIDEVRKKVDKKFIKKYGILKTYYFRFKLQRYIKNKEKHLNKYNKYQELHTNLSLAVACGFLSVKEHQKYLRDISKKHTKKI